MGPSSCTTCFAFAAVSTMVFGVNLRGIRPNTTEMIAPTDMELLSPDKITEHHSWGSTYTLPNPGAQNGPELVFVHVEKTAGMSIMDYIWHHAGGTLHVVNEEGVMPSELQGDAQFFRIGAVREPCDYYVSEYFWGIAGRGWLMHQLKREGLYESFYDGSKAAFKKWLYYISGLKSNATLLSSDRCGLLSMRVWSQDFNANAVREINDAYRSTDASASCASEEEDGCPCPVANCAAAASADHHDHCTKGFTDSNLGSYDCWIRAEHLDDDMRECMIKYVSRGGVATIAPSSKPTVTNTNGHPSCESMYDAESEGLINLIDGKLRDAFGYAECCKPHPGDKMPSFDQ